MVELIFCPKSEKENLQVIMEEPWLMSDNFRATKRDKEAFRDIEGHA